ncbi:hypothetical protein N9W20_00345 [Candidatus Pelagibacter bacterium]|nr:hypothetical protein [Candidatus Pelagibacter bacterium]
MPFIGQQPTSGLFIELDSLTASATANYDLQLNGANYYPESVNNLLVSINGVIQGSNTLSLSGYTLTVGATLSSSDTIDFVRVFGNVGTISTPTDGSVTANKIASGAVTSAKLDTNIAINGTLDVTGAISGTDMQLLHTTTVSSNVGEVQIDGYFTSAFKNYKLIASNVHTDTDGVNMNLKFMSGGSVLTGSVHRSVRLRAVSGGSTISCQNEASDTEFAKVGGVVGSATGEQSNFEVTFYDPLATDNFKHFTAFSTNVDSNANCEIGLMSAYYNSGQSALSGFEIDPSSGNIASGIFKLYGIR